MRQNEYLSDDDIIGVKKFKELDQYGMPISSDEDDDTDDDYNTNYNHYDTKYNKLNIKKFKEIDQYGMPIYSDTEDNDDNDDDNDEYIKEEELKIRNIINNKILNNDMFDIFTNETNKKDIKIKKDNKTKKNITLSDLNNLMETKTNELKPKKFVSRRTLDKQQISENKQPIKKHIELNKRIFNPRKVPYFFSDEYKNKKNKSNTFNIDLTIFPSL